MLTTIEISEAIMQVIAQVITRQLLSNFQNQNHKGITERLKQFNPNKSRRDNSKTVTGQ